MYVKNLAFTRMYVCISIAMTRVPEEPDLEVVDHAANIRERQREWVSEVLKREKKKRNVT